MAFVTGGSVMIVKLRKERIPFLDRYKNNKLLLKMYQHDLDESKRLYHYFEQYKNEDLAIKYKDNYYHTANSLAHVQSLISDDERWFVSISLATIALVLQSIFGIIL